MTKGWGGSPDQHQSSKPPKDSRGTSSGYSTAHSTRATAEGSSGRVGERLRQQKWTTLGLSRECASGGSVRSDRPGRKWGSLKRWDLQALPTSGTIQSLAWKKSHIIPQNGNGTTTFCQFCLVDAWCQCIFVGIPREILRRN